MGLIGTDWISGLAPWTSIALVAAMYFLITSNLWQKCFSQIKNAFINFKSKEINTKQSQAENYPNQTTPFIHSSKEKIMKTPRIPNQGALRNLGEKLMSLNEIVWPIKIWNKYIDKQVKRKMAIETFWDTLNIIHIYTVYWDF